MKNKDLKLPQKIEWEPKFNYVYNQVPIDGPQHVVLDKNFNPVCNPFYCKEYFQDIIWSELVQKNLYNMV